MRTGGNSTVMQKLICQCATSSNRLTQPCVTMRDIDIRAPSGDRCRNGSSRLTETTSEIESDEKSNNEFVICSQQIN